MLIINGVVDVLCLCVSPDDDAKSHVIWRSVIHLVMSLLVTMRHMFVPHAVDFIGVHQETIFNVRIPTVYCKLFKMERFAVAKLNCNSLENIRSWMVVLHGQGLLHRLFH